ncbi:MAG: hypothetical protein ABI851_14305 [Saprospiraceae bacterium]
MPTPTPADEYLSSFVQHFSSVFLLDTKAPPNTQLEEAQKFGMDNYNKLASKKLNLAIK